MGWDSIGAGEAPREGARHRRERKARAQAKGFLRSAAVLLRGHHGSAVPVLVANHIGMPDVGDDMVFGPRYPTWSCGFCSRGTSNWASRVVCLCGKRAPESVRAAAQLNAYGPPAHDGSKGKGKGGHRARQDKPPTGGKAAGRCKQGDAPSWAHLHTLAEEIRLLKLEKKADPWQKPALSEAGQTAGDVEDESAEALRLQIAELEATAKSSIHEPLRKFAKDQIEVLKVKLLDKKTPEDRQSAALWKLKRAKQKRVRIFEQAAESKVAFLAAQQALLELDAKCKAVDVEVASLESLLAEASPAPLQLPVVFPVVAISDEVLAHAEHGEEIKAMLVSPAYASLLKLHAMAKKEEVATPVPHCPGTAASGDSSSDVVLSDSSQEHWYDFGGDPSFFSEESFNLFKATSSRKEFTDMAHEMGFGCKKSRISKAEPY